MCIGEQKSIMAQRQPPMPQAQPSPVLNGISGAVRDPQFWRDVGGNASRAAQGLTSGVLGAPVDLMSAAVRPFAQMAGKSMPPESVVGSSEWIGNKMGQDVNSVPWLVGSFGPTPDGIDAMRMASMMDKFGPAALAGMTAWHGTPHRFAPEPDAPLGKFRLDKIGTGEGAQAYGHGIYVAESPDVAKSYQAMLTANPTVDLANSGDPAEWAAHLVRMHGGEDTAKLVLAGEDGSLLGLRPQRKAAYDAIVNGDYKKIGLPEGSLYSVDLPDEQIAKMLDWDAPLSEQPESVRQALQRSPTVQRYWGKKLQSGKEAHGSDVVRGEMWDVMKKEAAEMGFPNTETYLRELGIPGIRYLDGVSRGAGEGTRNFVLFDPEIAKIIGRE